MLPRSVPFTHMSTKMTESSASSCGSFLDQNKLEDFALEIDGLGRKIQDSAGLEDFIHLRKLERWGRITTLLGYATAWILPNPLSAYLISHGNYARWSLIFHPISHGALDKVSEAPLRYRSQKFAQGYRRFFDWFDWITPRSWHDEHNQMHHYFLGGHEDPDVVWRNTAFLRHDRLPMALRYAIAFIIACIWKPFYYAPNTLAESRFHRGQALSNKLALHHWNPLSTEGRELWLSSLLPYIAFRFVLVPALFFPLGKVAVLCVLINSLLAEVFTNIHSFLMIAPNHTGDDLYIFNDRPVGRGEFYRRQIIGTVNFRCGNDCWMFFFGGMNYQIEHHLWPKASLYQCRKVRPQLKALCQKYGIPYREASLRSRVLQTFQMMTGARKPLEFFKQKREVV